jgi:hypothetical protein
MRLYRIGNFSVVVRFGFAMGKSNADGPSSGLVYGIALATGRGSLNGPKSISPIATSDREIVAGSAERCLSFAVDRRNRRSSGECRAIAADQIVSMSSITASILVVACIFAGGLIGLSLNRVLRADHLTKETQDVVRLGIGMISVLSSLALGLLIATAKSSYDTTDNAVRQYAAELALLNETLRDYGGDASKPRDLLRQYTERLLNDIWPPDGAEPHLNDDEAATLMEHVREQARALHPVDDGQKWLRDRALTINGDLLRDRWLLIGEQGRRVSPILLGVLVSWITLIFISFGVYAPRNAMVAISFFVCSLAIGGAIFLILEMDRPLQGVLQISSWPVRSVLVQINW